MKSLQFASLFSIPVICLSIACTETEAAHESPLEYNLQSPVVHKMDSKLAEISGISFRPGNDSILYAIEDEHANFYRLSPDGTIQGKTDFGKKGDYEDVAITSNAAFVLRSDGTILTAIIPENDKDITSAVSKEILPSGEYEGLTVESDNSLIALCKNCKVKGTKGKVILYRISISKSNQLTTAEPILVQISDDKTGKDNKKLSPSGLARNPVDGSWFIISSVNKILVILKPDFSSPAIYTLDPKMFSQPEGICFNSKGTLFISNESAFGAANILEYKRK